MIALHTFIATLASFNARRLFEFSVSLLNVPTHGARLLCVGRGQLNRRIRYDIRRALGRKQTNRFAFSGQKKLLFAAWS